MPLYNLAKEHFELFMDDGTTPDGKRGTCRHDQPLFSIYAHLLNLEVLLHDTVGNGQLTMLSVDGAKKPIHITWNAAWLSQQLRYILRDTRFLSLIITPVL